MQDELLKENIVKSASNDADYDDPNMFFEYWSNLAKTDPERFERERAAEIEKVIVSAKPERQKGLAISSGALIWKG